MCPILPIKQKIFLTISNAAKIAAKKPDSAAVLTFFTSLQIFSFTGKR